MVAKKGDNHIIVSKPRQDLIFSLAVLIFIITLLSDSLLSDVSQVIKEIIIDEYRVLLFATIAIVAAITGIIITFRDSGRIKMDIVSRNNALNKFSRAVPTIQYISIGAFLIVLAQVIVSSQYSTPFPVAALAVSWSAGTVILSVMSYKLLQWYILDKKNSLVVMYLAATLIICFIFLSAALPALVFILEASPQTVNPQTIQQESFQANPQDFATLIVFIANMLVIPLSYFVWIATAIMLNRYSRKVGLLKYWVLLLAPLASAVIGHIAIVFYLPSVGTIFDREIITYTMMAFGGMITEGFLLGLAFIIISRSLGEAASSRIREYLSVSARGIAILFVSFFANPSAGAYPPFGLVSSSFLVLGAYLFFSGIYSSAISISLDSRLRQQLRSTLDQSNLASIGMANLTHELEKKTTDLIKRHEHIIMSAPGPDSSTVESEMKKYVQEVVHELEIQRDKKNSAESEGKEDLD
ncbi:MAG: hypothetical protein WBX01_14890 [Nitrososphaeraceae archaeon]